MNDRDQSPADERWLDLHLEEELGSAPAPDLAGRVVEELALQQAARQQAARQRAARQRAARQQAADAPGRTATTSRPPRSLTSVWLAAAMVVLGVTTVVAVLQLQPNANRQESGEPHGEQDPETQDPIRSSPATELRPKDLDEFRQHAAKASFFSIASGHSLPITMRYLVDELRVSIRDEATVDLFRSELQKLRKQPPAGWKWSNNIRVHLPDNRYIDCAMYAPDQRTLGIRGLGDFTMSEKLRAALSPRVVEVEIRTSLTAGNVTSRADLLREGDVAIPKSSKELRCSGLADDDLQLLARFANLESLALSRCAETITGPGLKHLLELTQLKTLKLRYSKVDDASLALLGSHPTLESLDVSSHERLTGTGLKAFAAQARLQSLKIGWGKTLTDEGLAAIASVRSLRTVDMSSRSIGKLTRKGFAHLGTMPELRTLNLSDLPGDLNASIEKVGVAPKLRDLDVSFTNVDAFGLGRMQGVWTLNAKGFRGRNPLRVLNLSGCKNRMQNWTTALLPKLPNLEHLKLNNASVVSIHADTAAGGEDFSEIQRLHKLHTLELNGARLTATDCRHIASLPSLRTLDLSFNGDGIDNEALQHLATAPQLERLELSGCDRFDDAGLKHLESAAALKHLDLNTCDGFTASGVASFRKAKPSCELRLPDRLR